MEGAGWQCAAFDDFSRRVEWADGAAAPVHTHSTLHMWVPDLGLALRACPGMMQSSGGDCSAPGISPCPLRVAGVTAQT
eukprot:7126250-Prymnesium_polylepis.1